MSETRSPRMNAWPRVKSAVRARGGARVSPPRQFVTTACVFVALMSVSLVAVGAAVATPPVPTITSLSPTTGPAVGGTVVTIGGTGFEPGTTAIDFSGTPAISVSCTSDTRCTATSPPGVGVVLVSVTTDAGKATDNVSPFVYQSSVTSISPAHGPQAGGTEVTITGSGLQDPGHLTLFDFGTGNQVSASCQSSTTCVVSTPAGNGTVDVTVGIFNGSGYSFSAANPPGDRFTYDASPKPNVIIPVITVVTPLPAGKPRPTCIHIAFACVPPPPPSCAGLTYEQILQRIANGQCIVVNPPHRHHCDVLDIIDLSCLPDINGQPVSFSLKIGGGFSPTGPGLNATETEVVVFEFGPASISAGF
jgi:IPT/TIG domain